MDGWIKVYREIKDHWIWKSGKLQWWLDILISVNKEPAKVYIKGKLVECGRGQSVRSLDSWAKDWMVTKKTVKTFFELLEMDTMLETENLQITTRITVCNYDSYQDSVNEQETQNVFDRKRTLPTNNNRVDIAYKEDKYKLYMQDGHLSITWDEMNKLIDQYGAEKAEDYVRRVFNWRKNSTVKSVYLTALNWIKKDEEKQKKPSLPKLAI